MLTISRRSHRRIHTLRLLLGGLALGAVLAIPSQGHAQGSCGIFASGAVISNGVVQLGVNCQGHLNFPFSPDPLGIGFMGLRYVPTGAASTEPGCQCEGWGVADSVTLAEGAANRSREGVVNITVLNFASTATTAVSTVRVGTTFEVTHDYRPSALTPNLYDVLVTIKNISASPVSLLYRRVMDWDVYPTPFSEFVTIVNGSATDLFRTDTNGFNDGNPLSFSSYQPGPVTDAGPADHGASFDFDFGVLAPGQTINFKTFYGATGTEADALTALTTVAAEAYSLGQANVPNGPSLGIPNTFIFGFAGIGGTPVFCGNNQVDPGEQCDDGNAVDGDGCDTNCRTTGCGNDIQTAGEDCDGLDDDACPGECSATCRCGECLTNADCNDNNPCTDDACSSAGGAFACENTNNTAPCSDGNSCTMGDVCDGGSCQPGTPIVCDDANPCTTDTCGAMGCESVPNGICAPNCGNLSLDPGETCDPPNLALNPLTGEPICRLNCTSCGDGTTQAGNGETCDDGNTVSGCDPARPLRELDGCLNNCTVPICNDPARIKFGPVHDQLKLHAQLIAPLTKTVGFGTQPFVLQLSRSGQTIFEKTIPAGALQTAGRGFKYKNVGARAASGVERLAVKRTSTGYKLTLIAYGNLRGAGPDMMLHVLSGSEEWTFRGLWEKKPYGWYLSGDTVLQ